MARVYDAFHPTGTGWSPHPSRPFTGRGRPEGDTQSPARAHSNVPPTIAPVQRSRIAGELVPIAGYYGFLCVHKRGCVGTGAKRTSEKLNSPKVGESSVPCVLYILMYNIHTPARAVNRGSASSRARTPTRAVNRGDAHSSG